jgi:acyl-CoA thioester hydrolase
VELQTRFADVDVVGHLNNVALADLYQEARVRFLQERAFAGSLGSTTWQAMIARITISYLGEVTYPTPVHVYVGVRKVGRTSYILSQALFQNGECRGTCRTVSVVIGEDRRPMPVPAALRERLEVLRVRDQPPATAPR